MRSEAQCLFHDVQNGVYLLMLHEKKGNTSKKLIQLALSIYFENFFILHVKVVQNL